MGSPLSLGPENFLTSSRISSGPRLCSALNNFRILRWLCFDGFAPRKINAAPSRRSRNVVPRSPPHSHVAVFNYSVGPFETSAPKKVKCMVFGPRKFEYWLLGHSGN